MKKFTLKRILIFLSVNLINVVTSEDDSKNILRFYAENVGKTQLKLNLSKESLDDVFLPTDEIISKYGYPIETHLVTTEDGYILQLHRIPAHNGKPILLQHGLLDSSATFVITGPKIAPAYYLWEQGYDVWLGNIRGNAYSRNHNYLNPDKSQFWEFTFHEMGIYDLPAMIDYILDVSNYKQLTYVGHSQGTTIFFIMCSKRPEYNKKVNVMHALAPIAFVGHMTSPILPIVSILLKSPLADLMYELISPFKFLYFLCFQEDQLDKVCLDMMFKTSGRNSKNFDASKLPIILGHFPAGTSVKDVRHFIQLLKSNRFCEYDYGENENLQKYGQKNPPDYTISNIRVPIVLFFGHYDMFSVQTDVRRLELALKTNVVQKIEGQWNHIDFIWATNVREIIYDKILSIGKNLKEDSF